jgi:RimJ/RimL family protein N-acetyltransferase
MNVSGPLDAGARTLGAVSAPTDAADALALADGTRLRLRALGPGDRDRVAALFDRLSPQSRYRRFLSPKSKLTPAELSYLTDIDHVHHVAIAAVDERDGSIVGVGRYVEEAGQTKVAEIAVVVADELHSMGVGAALVARTAERAWANGFTVLTARTLWENRPARALLRRLGFRARTSHGYELEVQLELDDLNVRQLTARHEPTTNRTWT